MNEKKVGGVQSTRQRVRTATAHPSGRGAEIQVAIAQQNGVVLIIALPGRNGQQLIHGSRKDHGKLKSGQKKQMTLASSDKGSSKSATQT